MSLAKPLEGKGYHIYCDNFYTSPDLFADLQKAGFEACGTVRKNRKGLSATFKSIKLTKGKVYTERILDDSMLCLKWQDKRDVLLLSTLHDDSMVEVQRRSRLVTGGVEGIKKPKVVHEYNQHMGGVDQSDQLLMYYGYSHRQVKWWKRVFFHLLDLSIVNASVLYNIVNTKQLTQLEFRVEVANGLLEGYTRRQPRHFTVSQELPLRLTERPFPEKVDTDTPHGGRPREECDGKHCQSSGQLLTRCPNVVKECCIAPVAKQLYGGILDNESGTHSLLTLYRNHDNVLNYVAAGGLTGCLFRVTAGLKPAIGGTALGMLLSFPVGMLMHGLDLALGGGKERERIRRERFKARAEMDEQWKAKLDATTGLIDTIEKELQPSVLNDGGLQDYYTINPSQDVDLAESDSATTDRNIHSTK
ncbi:hypothetical protein EMCRGX_G001206 [Ephydatia muelleri]